MANIYFPSLAKRRFGVEKTEECGLEETNQTNYLINVIPFQAISERAFDGLNNLKRLNLENNRLKILERGLFTATSGLTYLNLMRNSLETVTLHTIQPLMNNLVNHTSMLLIKGNFSVIYQAHQLSFPLNSNPLQMFYNSRGFTVTKTPLYVSL